MGDNITMLFCLGLLLFFCGLELNKRSLKDINGNLIKMIIKLLTDNIILCIITGIIITAMLQSSSAVSIILISLIEAKLIKLKPAVGIMLGANIGTTLTVQILSLPVLSAYFYFFIAGTFFMVVGKLYKKYLFKIGIILFSFALIFWGLNLMTIYFNYYSKKLLLTKILSQNDNILFAILLGGLITAIVQSSSVVTGITLSLANGGLITLPLAIAISLGSNPGTCITAFLATINSGEKAKALAIGHFIFNMLGIILLFLYYPLFYKLVSLSGDSLMRKIANAHTLFNIINLLIFLPFYKYFISFLRRNINC